MKIAKNKEEKSFSCLAQIISAYFPSEGKKSKSVSIENPKLLGEHFATQVLKQVKLS
jgi:hypothetical protein